MRIQTGEASVEYSMTPNGNLIERTKIGNGAGFLRATHDVERFLRWIISREVNHDIETRRRKALVRFLKSYWTSESKDSRAGHFNEDLYFQIINKKIENGTLEF